MHIFRSCLPRRTIIVRIRTKRTRVLRADMKARIARQFRGPNIEHSTKRLFKFRINYDFSVLAHKIIYMTAARWKFHIGSDLCRISFTCRRRMWFRRLILFGLKTKKFKINLFDFSPIGHTAGEISIEPYFGSVAFFVVFKLELHFAVFKKRPVLLPFRHKTRNLLMIVKALTGIEEWPKPINKLVTPPDVEKSDVAGFVLASYIQSKPIIVIRVSFFPFTPYMMIVLSTRSHVNRNNIIRRFGIKLHYT